MKNVRKRKKIGLDAVLFVMVILMMILYLLINYQSPKNVSKDVTETYEILSAKSIYGQMTNGSYVSIGIAGAYSSESEPIKGYELEISSSKDSNSVKTVLLKEEDVEKFIGEDDFSYVVEKTQTYNENGVFLSEKINKQTLYLPKSVLIENSLSDVKP